MSFIDSVSETFNRGVNAVNRTGKSAQLNVELNDLMHQRQELAAQLGASLYEQLKDDPTFTAGRESIFSDIAAIDERRAGIEAQLQQIKADQAAEKAAAQKFRCPRCGTMVPATDHFCTGCGLPMTDILAAQNQQSVSQQQAAQQQTPRQQASQNESEQTQLVCPNCGAPIEAGDAFCMNCGAQLQPEANTTARTTAVSAQATPATNVSSNNATPVTSSDEVAETGAAPQQ